jgi:hypothetical protein
MSDVFRGGPSPAGFTADISLARLTVAISLASGGRARTANLEQAAMNPAVNSTNFGVLLNMPFTGFQ